MTRDERRRWHDRSKRILETALAIARAEQAAKVFSPDSCAECDETSGLVLVYLRFGWGRRRTEWVKPPRMLCPACRMHHEGHWKYAKKPAKLPKPAPELRPVQAEQNPSALGS